MKLAHLTGNLSRWTADLHSLDGRPLGRASFCSDDGISSLKTIWKQALSYKLTITLGEHTLEAGISQGDGYDHGSGELVINGTPAGRWVANDHKCSVRDAEGRLILRYRMDSTRRRLKWALASGLPWKQARQYSQWGDLIIGREYVLASTVCGRFRWFSKQVRADLFHASDAAVIALQPPQEQLLILFLALRRLCGAFGGSHYQGGLGTLMSCPDVPSFCHMGQGSSISWRPEALGGHFSLWDKLRIYYHTGFPFLGMLSLAMLLLACCIPGRDSWGWLYFVYLFAAMQIAVVHLLEGYPGEEIRLKRNR